MSAPLNYIELTAELIKLFWCFPPLSSWLHGFRPFEETPNYNSSGMLQSPKNSIVLILGASQDGGNNLHVFHSPQEYIVHGFCLSRSIYLGIRKNRRIAMEHEHNNAGHASVSDWDCQIRVFDSI